MESVNNKVIMDIHVWSTTKSIWKKTPIEIYTAPLSNLGNRYVKIKGPRVYPDKSGNFTGNLYSPWEVDAIHTFACALLTITLWEQAVDHKVQWAWKNLLYFRPLKIDILDPLTNAQYLRSDKQVSLGTIRGAGNLACRSLDIVAHEITHAIIDGIYYNRKMRIPNEHLQLIEEICDVSSIFIKSMLYCTSHKFYNLNKSKTSNLKFIKEFALGFGPNPHTGIRYSPKNISDLSIYNIMSNKVRGVLNSDMNDQFKLAKILYFKKEFFSLVKNLPEISKREFLESISKKS